MNLATINKGVKRHKRSRRVGRGPGSGRGKTSARGNKGQGQLAGFSAHPVFQGGSMPLVRRIPKRGFNNPWALRVGIVNIGALGETFKAGAEVTPDSLREAGLVQGRVDVVKVLGTGELKHKLKVSAHRFSAQAAEKIRQAGGEAIVLAGPTPVAEKQAAAKAKKKQS